MPVEVVSDTTPLQYLHQARCLEILPALYGTVVVPRAVLAEVEVGLAHGVDLPDVVSLSWVRVRSAPRLERVSLAASLGRGEIEVLSLAAGRPGVLSLLDDRLARSFASELGIRHTGTLGVLLEAKTAGVLAAVRPIIDRLQELGFWLDPKTRRSVLEVAGEP